MLGCHVQEAELFRVLCALGRFLSTDKNFQLLHE